MSDLIEQEIERAIGALCRDGVARRMPEEAVRRHLDHLVARVAAAARSATLLSIRSAEEAAAAWGVTPRRAQAHIKMLHERHGVGARIGRAWLITEDEIARYRPGAPGRPPVEREESMHFSEAIAILARGRPRDPTFAQDAAIDAARSVVTRAVLSVVGGRDDDGRLGDWIANGDYIGNETPEAIAAEWRSE